MKDVMFFDIDGTLLAHGEHKLRDNTVNALKELQENGIIVVICTGRNLFAAIEFAKQANITNLICGNGMEVYNNNELIYHSTLDRDILNHTVENIASHATFIGYMTSEGAYTLNNPENERSEHFDGYGDMVIKAVDILPEGEISKLFIRTINLDEQDIVVNNIHESQKVYRWSEHDAEIIPIGDSKANGIIKFIESLPKGEYKTYGFGDGANDFEMLEHVDVAVAMENGQEKLKEIADYIADDILTEGVVSMLKQLDKIK